MKWCSEQLCHFSTPGMGAGPLSLITPFAAEPCGANPAVSMRVLSGCLEERRRALGWERKKQHRKEPDGEYGKDRRCAGRQGGNKQTGWRGGEKAGGSTVKVLRKV